MNKEDLYAFWVHEKELDDEMFWAKPFHFEPSYRFRPAKNKKFHFWGFMTGEAVEEAMKLLLEEYKREYKKNKRRGGNDQNN